MFLLACLLHIGCVLGGPRGNVSNVHGVYYFPSVIGINPLSSSGQTNLYNDYFAPIHERDLDLIQKVGNYIRLPGSATRFLTTDFLDLCHERGIGVILTWSLMEYNLRVNDIRQWKQLIKLEFQSFVEKFKNHPAVKMWSFGDLYDPVVGQDDQSQFTDSVDFMKRLIALWDELLRLLALLDDQNPKPIGMAMFMNLGDPQAIVQTPLAIKAMTLDLDFDFWILVYAAEDLLAESTPLPWGLDPSMWANLDPLGGDRKSIIVQFTSSAYVEGNFQREVYTQSGNVQDFVNKIMDPAPSGLPNTRSPPILLGGVIFQEWSDQWWRGDTAYGCGSGLGQPYFQSRCSRGFQGMVAQYNQFGYHCIKLRPAITSWGKVFSARLTTRWNQRQTYDMIKAAGFYNGTKPPSFNGLVPDQSMCVMVWPTFFSSHEATVSSLVPLIGLAAVAVFLWFKWMRQNRQEQKEISLYLDKGALKQADAKKKEPPAEKKAEVKVDDGDKTLRTAALELPRSKIERELELPERTVKIQMTSNKPLPLAGGPWVNAPQKADKKLNAFLLELYLREHIRKAKLNLDQMIEHEFKVMQTLSDHALMTGMRDLAAVHAKSLRTIHTRMLEGYVCWLDRLGKLDSRPTVRCEYAEALCFRLMVSVAEHIAHCPERLAQVFHHVLQNCQNDVLTIDLDALQRGLEGDKSINEGTVNFDDINDCGILDEADLKKTWFESPGPAVVLDYLRDYDVIFFFKLWLFCIAVLVRLDAWDPEYFLYPFCQIEAAMFGASELILFIYHWCFQNKALPRDRIWGLGTAGGLGAFIFVGIPVLEDTLGLLIPCGIYGACRIIYCMLPHQVFKFILQRDSAKFYRTHIRGRPKKKAQKSDADEKANSSLYLETTHVQSIFFWAMTFALTLVVEVYLIVPIAASMSFEKLCWETQMERCLIDESIWGNNVCLSCNLSVFLAHALMMVTVFSDTPLVFYLSVSLWGYYKGQSRKVQNVFATTSCMVDLRANGLERKNMEAVFGKWETNACEMWCAMILELYQRDLICDADKLKLSTPGKKWDFTGLSREPRERLSFWLQTVKSMARQWKRHRDQAGLLEDQTRAKLKSMLVDEDTKAQVGAIEGQIISAADKAKATRRKQLKDKTTQWKGPLYIAKGTNALYIERQMGKASIHSGSDNGQNEEKPACWEQAVEDSYSLKDKAGFMDDLEDAKSSSKKKSNEKKVPGKTGKEKGNYAKLRPEPSESDAKDDTDAMLPFDLTDEENADRDLRSIPRLSHVITCYSETVMLSMDYLRDRNGNLTNLEHMIDLTTYRQEWAHMEERFRSAHALEPSYDILIEFLNLRHLTEGDSYDDLEEALVREVRLWSSYRAQTIIRTIRGALSYHDALLKRFQGFEQKDGKECDLRLNDFAELIVAHQTYGSYPRAGSPVSEIDGWKNRRQDMDWILKNWQNYPIFLVYDHQAAPPPPKRVPTGAANEDFDFYWQEQVVPFIEADEKELQAYWEQRATEYKLPQLVGTPNFTNATCIKCMKDGVLKLVAVLPRMLPLRIGKKDKTQGKAANQINALRCVSGHVIQVSDANMDGWIGEGFKLPFITRMFTDGDVSRRWVGDRTSVLYRIIGFREYIFTGPLGPVGIAMASSEFTFGTLFQRVLSDPLNVRMHYGHPDFFDAFWVINRGTLSKASPRLNLSEDVFSGYNTVLRNEKITHSDGLEWQKGREVVFTASSGFLVKITAGSVAIQRTRDMKMMQYSLSFTKKLSLYFGGIGGFILNFLIDMSIILYVMFFTFSAYATITLADISLSSSLGLEWLVGLGLVTSLGYMTEMMLEYGWGAGLVQVLKCLPITSLFYLFQNKCMAHAIVDSVRTGDAQYFDSGRPNAFDHYSLRTMYDFYAESHYYPALQLVGLIYFYNVFVGNTGGVLPMFLVMITTVSWILAPVVFCPQISNLNILQQDTVEVMNFVFATRDKLDAKTGKESLDKFWRDKEKAFHKLDMLGTRIIWWIGLLIPTVLLWSLAFSALIDRAMLFVWVWAWHCVVTAIFNFSNYTNVVRGVWYFVPLVGTLLISVFTPSPTILSSESLLGAVLFLSLLRVVHWLLLIILSVLYRVRNCRATEEEKKTREISYNHFVNHAFFIFLNYHLHLYCGILVTATQVVFQLALMVISWVWSWIRRFYYYQQVNSAADLTRLHGDVKVVM